MGKVAFCYGTHMSWHKLNIVTNNMAILRDYIAFNLEISAGKSNLARFLLRRLFHVPIYAYRKRIQGDSVHYFSALQTVPLYPPNEAG